MNKFVNRTVELKKLQERYLSPNAELVILYGRRRLGKTRLLKEFCSGYPHCYFMADRAGEASLLKSLALALSASLDEPLLQSVDYPHWYELFAAFDRFRPQTGAFVLILDEYQYICQVQPAFSTFIQKWWDEHWQHSNVMLVLCGSVTSMMYRETMAQSAPLYGRATLQLLLSPLEYHHLRDFLPDYRENELVKMYALCGGVPRYLELLAGFSGFDEALEHLVLDSSGLLYQEARYLLHEEISSPNTCWSILQSLGSGTGRISEIGARLGLPANQLTHYMDLLRDLFLVYREVPVLEKNPAKSKKGFYQVADPFLRLWFGTIFPYESFLEFGRVDTVKKRLKPQIDAHISHCFELLCRKYVALHANEFDCLKVGRQWSSHYEIDVAGVNGRHQLNLIGECKWSTRKVGLSIFHELRDKVEKHALPVTRDCTYVLFSRSGFTDELQEQAATNENLALIDSIFDWS